jgi:hypothetical protein
MPRGLEVSRVWRASSGTSQAGRDSASTGRVHDALYELDDFLAVASGYAGILETQIAGRPANNQHPAERLGEINVDVARMRRALVRVIEASRRVTVALQPRS